jgi:DNA-binding transcriptional ArsR family regulator
LPKRPRRPFFSPYQPPTGFSGERPQASTVPSAAGFCSSALPSAAGRRGQRPGVGRRDHEAFDALGDANRRAIVEILGSGERSVQEIADRLPISRPAVSRHLRLLKDAGLVSDETEGTRHIYRLRAEGVEAIREYFAEVWGEAVTRFRIVAENVDRGSYER